MLCASRRPTWLVSMVGVASQIDVTWRQLSTTGISLRVQATLRREGYPGIIGAIKQ